jgi:hypothetical protein
LFNNFLEAVGKYPFSIVTDQDPSITIAITSCFPNTVHKFCVWHIVNKFSSKIGFSNFGGVAIFELSNLIWWYRSPKEFDDGWNCLIEKHGLSDNKWLKSIFNRRESWVPTYMCTRFFAGLKTTQRSESIHSFLSSSITK